MRWTPRLVAHIFKAMRLRTRSSLEARRLAYVERIDPADLTGVPAGHTVTLAARIRCRDCRAQSWLPARARTPEAREVRYELHARRCPAHRRSWETPSATPRVRDVQRGAVYRWERWLPGGETEAWRAVEGALEEGRAPLGRLLPHGPNGHWAPLWSSEPQISFDACERFARSVWAELSPLDPEPPPRVVLTRRRRVSSAANAEEIELAPSMLRRMVVLHELAHAYLGRTHPHGTIQGHGPEYAACYLGLLARWLGVPEGFGRRLGEGMRPRWARFPCWIQIVAPS